MRPLVSLLLSLAMVVGHPSLAGIFDLPGPCSAAAAKFAVDNYNERLRIREANMSPEERLAREERSAAWAKYWKQMRASYGGRLFFRPTDPTLDREELLRGLLTAHDKPKPHWTNYFDYINPLWHLQLIPRGISRVVLGKQYEFSPMRAVYRNFFDRPVRRLTRKEDGRSYQPTAFFKFSVVDLPLGLLLYTLFDEWYKKRLNDRRKQQIEEAAPDWDELIEHDARFEVIRNDLQKGLIKPEEARQAAFIAQNLLKEYETYMASDQAKKDDPELRRGKRLQVMMILAPHVSQLINQGTVETPGFEVDPKDVGPLSSGQIDQILDVQDMVFARQHIVRLVALDDTKGLEKLEAQDPSVRKLVASLKEDEFVQVLIEAHKDGDLTRGELINELQRDQQWRGQLASSKIAKMRPLKIVGEVATKDTMTLRDVQLETLEFIAERAKKRAAEKAEKK